MTLKITLLLVGLLLLSACTQSTMENMDDDMDHMGCQEGEIINGTCTTADDNNAMLFSEDVSDLIISETTDLGYFAQPVAEGTYPGVVMIHEWWGLNENIMNMADLLASKGYYVIAVDLYGEYTNESSRARELATNVRENPDEAVETMKSAVAFLEEQQATSVGSMGWCFGGQQSLLLSRSEDLDATVIYYGNLVTDEESLSVIESPVLGIFGEEDGGIPVSSVREFETSLNSLGIENEIYIYPGVGHAFANPSGSNYAPEETVDAWDKTLVFLNEHLD